MHSFPKKLTEKLQKRKDDDSFRVLTQAHQLVDFSSNDYIGFATSDGIFEATHKLLHDKGVKENGATGSRLISGNYSLYSATENMLAQVHQSESAIIFNSGYDANIGLLSSVPQRGDIIFYDEFIHASIRDGIAMSNAKSYKFTHNDLEDLEKRFEYIRTNVNSSESSNIYVVTESVFSMDGDTPDLHSVVSFCEKNNCFLIVDEAHAVGVYGEKGCGLLQELKIEDKVFARVITFGKALGCHGAVVLGSQLLKNYLVNFSRSFIYTTGLPPHSLATIQSVYTALEHTSEIKKLKDNIQFFKEQVIINNLEDIFIASTSTIQCCVIPGIRKVKEVAHHIQEKGFMVKPIVSPTVPEGKERVRFCLHSYNSKEEIAEVVSLLATFVFL